MSRRRHLSCRNAVILSALVISSLFLFARLGHYALWDDEAITGLHALGVWRTGDMTAVIGRNVVGYHGGATLTGLQERYIPPLSFYLAAMPVGLSGGATWASRLPFALCGLACVCLLMRWAWRERIGLATWCLLALALTGNVSFFLFSRQCRYYAPAILASVALAYLYRFRDGRLRTTIGFSLISIALFATNYMNYLALYVCLAIDYLAWGRKERRLSREEWLWLLVPQLIACPPIVWVWNPLTKTVVPYRPDNWFADKATLFWRSWRDLAKCEFGVAALLLASPLVARLTRRLWLIRASIAMLVYVCVVTLISPQPVGVSPHADIRYLAPTIPLCIAIGVGSLRGIGRLMNVSALPLGILAFWTSLLPGGRDWEARQWSTIGEYVHELAWPPSDPYTETVRWIKTHVVPGQSIFVAPNYPTYPLMYHAPEFIYAWQFRPPLDPQFAGLDPIHHFGRIPPDYVVAFGSEGQTAWKEVAPPGGSRYHEVARLEFFWRQLQRPELIWHTFRGHENFDRDEDSIFIYRKAAAARSPGRRER
jgi:hypothetical protein